MEEASLRASMPVDGLSMDGSYCRTQESCAGSWRDILSQLAVSVASVAS
jgi:hypothetical protein